MAARVGFETLPLELRQQIFHFALTGDLKKKLVKVSLAERSDRTFKLVSSGLEAIKPLVLTGRSISSQVLDYCFGKFTFCLTDYTHSSRFIVREFRNQIGPTNLKIVHHIIIPHFSIDHVFDGLELERWGKDISRCRLDRIYKRLRTELRGVLTLLACRPFPSLRFLDLGIDVVECFPRGPGGSRRYTWLREDDCKYALQKLDDLWSSRSPTFPMAAILQDATRLPKSVQLGIYWNDVGTYWEEPRRFRDQPEYGIGNPHLFDWGDEEKAIIKPQFRRMLCELTEREVWGRGDLPVEWAEEETEAIDGQEAQEHKVVGRENREQEEDDEEDEDEDEESVREEDVGELEDHEEDPDEEEFSTLNKEDEQGLEGDQEQDQEGGEPQVLFEQHKGKCSGTSKRSAPGTNDESAEVPAKRRRT